MLVVNLVSADRRLDVLAQSIGERYSIALSGGTGRYRRLT